MEETDILELDLDWSLTETDIDEILGKERNDTAGLAEGFIDEQVDEFVEKNDSIPPKKKGLFADLFKKDIKKQKAAVIIPNKVEETGTAALPDIDYKADDYNLAEMLVLEEEYINIEEFNAISSTVFPDTAFTREQIAEYEHQFREFRYQYELEQRRIAEQAAEEARIQEVNAAVPSETEDNAALSGDLEDFFNADMPVSQASFNETIDDIDNIPEDSDRIVPMDGEGPYEAAGLKPQAENETDIIEPPEFSDGPSEGFFTPFSEPVAPVDEPQIEKIQNLIESIPENATEQEIGEIKEQVMDLIGNLNCEHSHIANIDRNFLELSFTVIKEITPEEQTVLSQIDSYNGQLLKLSEIHQNIINELKTADITSEGFKDLLLQFADVDLKVASVNEQITELSKAFSNPFLVENPSIVADVYTKTQGRDMNLNDIVMLYPVAEHADKIQKIQRDMSCLNSSTDPSISNTALDSNEKKDPELETLFSADKILTNNVSFFNDPEQYKYYDASTTAPASHVSQGEKNTPVGTSVNGKMETLLNGIRPATGGPGGGGGNGNPPSGTNTVSANAPAANKGGTMVSEAAIDESRKRQANDIMNYSVNKGYTEYAASIGEMIKNNAGQAVRNSDGEVQAGLRQLKNSEAVFWIKTILGPVGTGAARDSIKHEGVVLQNAAETTEKYIKAGKLSVNDLNVGNSEACQKIRDSIAKLNMDKAGKEAEIKELNEKKAKATDSNVIDHLDTKISTAKAQLQTIKDNISSNEKSLKEQKKQDYRDLKDKIANIEKEKGQLSKDINKLSAEIKRTEARINTGGLSDKEKSKLTRELVNKKNELSNKKELEKTLGGSSPIRNRDILKHHRELFDKFTAR